MPFIIAYPTPTITPVAQPVTSVFRVIQGSHDGYSRLGSETISVAGTELVSNDISSTSYDYATVVLFTPDAANQVPKSKTIQSAKLFLTQKANRSSAFPTKIMFEAADNPIFPTNRTDQLGRSKGVVLTWNTNSAWITDQVVQVDVTAQIQAIVNRSGYAAGNRIQWHWEFNQTGYQENNNHQLWSFDGGGAEKAPRLEVTFIP